MRYLLDTNTVIYFATDHSKLDKDVISILQDETNLLYMSAESVREIIVAYKNKGFVTKKWKTCNEFLDMIANGELAEFAEYVDNFYGTPVKTINSLLKSGNKK